MGRRRLWIIVGAALVLAGGVLVLVASGRQMTSFHFLDGHSPTTSSTMFLVDGHEYVSYSWTEDARSVLRRARPELAQLGFAELSQSLDDWVFQRGKELVGIQRQNWTGIECVEVGVLLKESPTMWGRIKAVFGL